MTERCSIRQAAQRLGCARATLQRLLSAEPSLARAVLGRGPRGSTLVSMEVLEPAWQALSGTGTEGGLSDRQRLDQARRRRCWFDLQALLIELDGLEAGAVNAQELAAVHERSLAALRAAAAGWADCVAAGLPLVPPEEAHTWIESTVHDALMQVITAHRREPEPPPPPREIRFPDDPPTLLSIKALTEHTRARIAEVRLQLQRGELLDFDRLQSQLSSEALRLRDGWRRVGTQLAIRRRSLTTPEQVRTVALQELSRVGLV